MAYATTITFSQRSGLGIRVFDENVGTGTGSLAYFDLDFYNIVAGSYVLSYAASGSNNFTALTETTHYTLDKESGRIVITAAGLILLSTNILYATYTYIEGFSDGVITDLISAADDEIDELTGRKWDTATSRVEYHDGRRTLGYPTTNQPYTTDWDQPDFIMLKKYPVTKIDAVYFLAIPTLIGKFFNYDDNLGTYTDYTDEINSSTEAPFTLFAAVPAANDIVYFGHGDYFLGLDINLSTLGTGSPAITWQYYNGSTWTSLSVTEVDASSSTFKANGKFTWTFPYGWAKTIINGSNQFWVRGLLTVGYTIAPIISTATMRDIVTEVVESRSIIFKSNGRLAFTGTNVQDGTQNIRVDYYYGQATTPSYIEELSILMAAVKAYVNLTGGNYDSATSYTVVSKSVSIGDKVIKLQEVLTQYKARISEILNMIGRRAALTAI